MKKLLRMHIYLRDDSAAVNEEFTEGGRSCADYSCSRDAIKDAIQTLQQQLEILDNEALTSSHL